jgi:hypothetical protein
VLARHDHLASVIVNANRGAVSATEKLHVLNRVIRLGVLQAAERQRIQEQIKAAFIFAARKPGKKRAQKSPLSHSG